MPHRCSPEPDGTSLKRETVILPLRLPCLTDKGAAQLVELLRELLTSIEHHYGAQIHRYRRRQQDLHQIRKSHSSTPGDPPF